MHHDTVPTSGLPAFRRKFAFLYHPYHCASLFIGPVKISTKAHRQLTFNVGTAALTALWHFMTGRDPPCWTVASFSEEGRDHHHESNNRGPGHCSKLAISPLSGAIRFPRTFIKHTEWPPLPLGRWMRGKAHESRSTYAAARKFQRPARMLGHVRGCVFVSVWPTTMLWYRKTGHFRRPKNGLLINCAENKRKFMFWTLTSLLFDNSAKRNNKL